MQGVRCWGLGGRGLLTYEVGDKSTIAIATSCDVARKIDAIGLVVGFGK